MDNQIKDGKYARDEKGAGINLTKYINYNDFVDKSNQVKDHFKFQCNQTEI